MNKTLLFLSLFFFTFMVSCTSDGKSDIKIFTPENGQSFNLGDIIEVKAEMYDSDLIRGELLLVTLENGDTIFNFRDIESHGQSHTFTKSFEATNQGNYNINVSTFSGGSKNVTIKVN